MFPLFLNKVLFPPSCCSSISSQIRTLGTLIIRFQAREFSSASSSPSQPHCKPVEEEEDNFRVSVLWDFESCGVPSGVSYLKVAPSIMGALRTKGFNGPIHIQAYGNVYQLSEINQEILFLTGINLHHIPGGSGNNSSCRYLMDWISQNPPPAHLFMISGNGDCRINAFVHRLSWHDDYNILFACPRKPEYILCSSSTIMWWWPSMLKGKYLTGRHFKDPPLWCRIPRMPCENPFTDPLEMPHEDPFLDPAEKPSSHIRDDDSKSLHSIGEYTSSLSSEKVMDVSSALLRQIQPPRNNSDISKNSDNDTIRSEDGRPEILEKKTNSQDPSTCNDYIVLENNDIANCEFGIAENKHENPAKEVDEVCHSPYSSPFDNSLVEKKRHDGSPGKSSPFFNWISSWCTFWKSSAKSDDLHQDVMHLRMPELFEDSKLAEVDQTASDFEDPKLSKLHRDVSHSEMHGLFSLGSFWDVVESFVFTPRGSLLLSQSKSREDMTHKLQKHGPPVLRCLTEHDILQLVELLISEKKWLEESPSQAFPFRPTQTAQKSSLMGRSHGANGLRSLFINKTPQFGQKKNYKNNKNNKKKKHHSPTCKSHSNMMWRQRCKTEEFLL